MALTAILCLIVCVAAQEAWPVDGNYTSPYASQWDNRSTAASISNDTILGGLLLLGNLVTLSVLKWRNRRTRTA